MAEYGLTAETDLGAGYAVLWGRGLAPKEAAAHVLGLSVRMAWYRPKDCVYHPIFLRRFPGIHHRTGPGWLAALRLL